MAFSDHVAIDANTRLILGQPLDTTARQPDVANAIVHRTGDTLVIVDTGATPTFRAAIKFAAGDLAPWSRVLLLSTHGHADHVANNDIITDLGGEAAHYVSAHDAGQLIDNGRSYWTTSIAGVAGIVPGFDDPGAAAAGLLTMFEPFVPRTRVTRTFEELPLEHLRVGPQHFTGWSFCDGAVSVIRTQGHCAGQVIVYLAETGLLHLSDEPNGPCGAMHDADQVKILTAIASALTLVEANAVEYVTEGHAFEVFERDAARARLESLLDQAAALDGAAQDLIPESGVDSNAFAGAFAAAQKRLGISGANPNPMFSAMTAIAKLRDQGLIATGEGSDLAWQRPALDDL